MIPESKSTCNFKNTSKKTSIQDGKLKILKIDENINESNESLQKKNKFSNKLMKKQSPNFTNNNLNKRSSMYMTPEETLSMSIDQQNKISIKSNERYLSIQIFHNVRNKSKIMIIGGDNSNTLTAKDFQKFIELFDMFNLNKQISDSELNISNQLIKLFIRILIKKGIINRNFQNEKWTASLFKSFLKNPIKKKKEESLKLIFREIFKLLMNKYKTIHYYYWNFQKNNEILKLNREDNINEGFYKYYFEELIIKNRKKGIDDSFKNYILPNKKNGNIISNNKSINPIFIKHLFQSKKFKRDVFSLFNSSNDSHLIKNLKNTLSESSQKKLQNWKMSIKQNMSYNQVSKLLQNKVSGSKAKLPWFDKEIDSAIKIVWDHINHIIKTKT